MGQGDDAPATNALDTAAGQHHCESGRSRAQNCADRKTEERDNEQLLASENMTERSNDRLEYGRRQKVRSARPERFSSIALELVRDLLSSSSVLWRRKTSLRDSLATQ